MTFGVTDEGFAGKRLADVIEEAEVDLSAIKDPVSGELLDADFSSDDPTMQIAKVPLVGVADAWESSKLVFDQFNPSLATGPSLSGLVQLNGIKRLAPAKSTDTITLTGTPLAPIPAGSLIGNTFGTQEWSIDEDVVLDGTGSGVGKITNTINGAISVDAGELTAIITPESGWLTVANDGNVSPGRVEESHQELRVRRSRSTLAPAAAPADSVWANVKNLDGVSYVRVLINNTLKVDARGLSPKNQAVIVVGGDDEEIAKTILQRSGASVEFFGTTSVIIYDAQNEPYPVRFIRPTPVDIYVDLEITVINQSVFPENGIELIKQAIIDYVKDGADALGVFTGFRQDGFGPGALIILSRLFTPINSIAGHTVESLSIGRTQGTESLADIALEFTESPNFTFENINITVNL